MALPISAAAQAYQCVPPTRVDPPRPIEQDGPTRRAVVSWYTLAISWSPEFCRGEDANRPGNAMQCSGANGRFGFVLHGLWPEARSGAAPQWCSLTPRPSPETVRRNLCMTPLPWLIEHEWAKHGSCMARTPEGYYRVASILWRSLRFPDTDHLSRDENLAVGTLRQAFVAANPGWRADAVGVVTSRTGWLRELHLCYSRRYLPMRCPRGQFGPPDSAPLKIWRGL
ncbi:MAG TPA: ribonuclease T [Novosphingobium sp.]|nr:ribonuclease T [Novosphingobium sp.]